MQGSRQFVFPIRHWPLLLLLLAISSALAADDNQTAASIEVTLDGAPAGQSEILLNGLSIVRQQRSPRLSERLVQRLHQQAIDELRSMMEVLGFYHAEISGDLQFEAPRWQAHYTITAGQPVTISSVDLQIVGAAAEDPAFQRLQRNFALQPGTVFSHAAYEAGKRDILRLAAERGYFDGRLIRSRVEVKPEENTATIYLHYDSEQRYRFAELDYPKTVIGRPLLQRMTPFQAGEPYEASKVLAFRNNLNNSGYFDNSSVQALSEQRDDGQVPVSIAVDPTAKHRYSAGIGYGTDTGARLGLGWENRYVNQRGHRLSADTRLSQVTSRLGAEYLMPFWSERISALGINTELKQQETDTSDSRAFTLGGFYNTSRFGWAETGSIRLLNERFKIADETTTSTMLIPGVSWSRTWADDTMYSRRGASLTLSMSGAAESVLSDVSFGQTILRGKVIRGLGERGRFISRATLGATGVSDFDRLPSSLRFFAGGDNSIRGFDFESLGPENRDGDVVGGRYLAVGSVEYEHMFLQNWGAALFSDFGNAFNDWGDPIEYSIGIGVRWRSPVGLIRVDVARGISADNKPFGLHIVIGPDF